MITIACRMRLAVAIVKRCVGATCTGAQIAAMLDKPGDYFQKDSAFPAALCWSDAGEYLPAPAELAQVQRIVVDGIELVDPMRLAQGPDRAVAAIHLVLEILERIQGSRDERVLVLGELAAAPTRAQWQYGVSVGYYVPFFDLN